MSGSHRRPLAELVAEDPELQTYTLAEVAHTYGISRRSLQRYARTGKLAARRFGRHTHVTEAALKDFLAAGRSLKAPAPPARPGDVYFWKPPADL